MTREASAQIYLQGESKFCQIGARGSFRSDAQFPYFYRKSHMAGEIMAILGKLPDARFWFKMPSKLP
jgi:hypothetical protein